jgi:type II secretory pathway component PulC
MRVLKLIIQKYPWVVMAPFVGGIILLGVSTAYTMYRAFSYSPPAVPKTMEAQADAPESRPTLDHYTVISKRDLFASALSGIEEKTQPSQNKGSTAAVPFKLRGTMVVSPGASAAIIEDPATRKQELFHEDEMVQGFKIVRILRNKIIIDKDGREEVVEVVEEKTAAKPVQRPRTIKRPPARRAVPVKPPPKRPPNR